MGEMNIAAAVVLLATVVCVDDGLLPAPLLVRRTEVARFMLRRGQHVGNLPGFDDLVVQACLYDQVNRLFAAESETRALLAISIAHVGFLVVWRVLYLPGRSEEHTSELQSLLRISYAVFCLKKKLHTIIKKFQTL